MQNFVSGVVLRCEYDTCAGVDTIKFVVPVVIKVMLPIKLSNFSTSINLLSLYSYCHFSNQQNGKRVPEQEGGGGGGEYTEEKEGKKIKKKRKRRRRRIRR